MALIFNGSAKSAWGSTESVNAATRILDVASPAPPTAFATSIAFEIRDGERPAGNSATKSRCELMEPQVYACNKEYWKEFYIYVPTSWENNHNWNYVWQVHLRQEPGSQAVLMFTGSPGNVLELMTGTGGSHPVRWDTAFTENTWHRFGLHFRFTDTASTGFVELWYNGVQQTFDAGGTRFACAMTPSGYSARSGADLNTLNDKIGIYRREESYSNTTFLYHHANKIWDADPGTFAGGGGGEGEPEPGAPATPTVTAAPDATRFGKVTGTVWTGMGANSKRGSIYTLPVLADVPHGRAWLDGWGPAAAATSQPCKLVVHDAEDLLVGTSSEVTITKEDDESWVLFDFPTNLRLPAGDYRLGIISSATGQVIRYAHGTTSNSLSFGADTYSDGPTTTWGVTGVDSKDMTIYLAYTEIEDETDPGTTPPPAEPGVLRLCGSGSRRVFVN